MSGVNLKSPDCPHADDPSLCRITFMVEAVQPFIPWTQEYDGEARATNSDPNTYVKTFTCSVCLLNWQYTWTGKEDAVLTRLPEGARVFPPQVF